MQDDALEWIAKIGYSEKYGGENIKRAVLEYVEESIREEILSGRLKEGMEARHGVEYGAQRLRMSGENKINKGEENEK